MLRTNSKKVDERVKQYITNNFFEVQADYDLSLPTDSDFSLICNEILKTFFNQYLKGNRQFEAGRLSRYDLFVEWCEAGTEMLDTSYYTKPIAIDLLGDWLEETKEERNRFTESQAEQKITYLLYKTITRHATRTGILY